jgi:hypothetical protein
MITAVNDRCTCLFGFISKTIQEETAKETSYSYPFDLDMYANPKSFKRAVKFYGDREIRSSATGPNEQGNYVTKRPDDCIWAGYSEELRLLQGQRDIPLVTAEYG